MKRLPVLFALTFSCHLVMPSGKVPTEGPEQGPVLETMTYNVGLAPGVEPYATPRIKPIAQELAKFRGTGVMCIEEAWTRQAKDEIIAAIDLPPENIFYVDTIGQGDDLSNINVCKPGQLDGVAACAKSKCGSMPTEDQTRCAYQECKSELISLYGLMGGGEDCLDCLIASVGTSLDTAFDACTTPGHGVTHAYGGQNGEILVSHFPLKNRESILLPSSIANRPALFATIEIDGREPIEVACLHAATDGEVPPSHRGPDGQKMFSSWDEEMNAQMDIVSERLKQRAGHRPQLLLGDLNAGPALGHGIGEDMPKVWSHIVSLGFTSPAAEADHPFCSVCDDDTQRRLDMPNPGKALIDHVLVRDPHGGSTLIPMGTRRLFDTYHEAYYPGYDGRMVEGHLSDHYAVTVSFRYE